tara:strand:- start:831 stop:1100 length:270 start_codon:yes stop_codon:yes gene_type:complete
LDITKVEPITLPNGAVTSKDISSSQHFTAIYLLYIIVEFVGVGVGVAVGVLVGVFDGPPLSQQSVQSSETLVIVTVVLVTALLSTAVIR